MMLLVVAGAQGSGHGGPQPMSSLGPSGLGTVPRCGVQGLKFRAQGVESRILIRCLWDLGMYNLSVSAQVPGST